MVDKNIRVIKDKNVPSILDPKKYKKLKIEKLGNSALKFVLDAIKKGNSYARIAEMLSESYGKKVTYQDVSAVLSNNAQIMSDYRLFLNNENIDRANLVINETTVLTERMENMNDLARELESRSKSAITTKEIIEISKAQTDLARTQSVLIKDFKKITGQFKESPSIVIDNSRKELNINASPELSDNLAKQLAQATFIPENKKEKINVVDVKFEEEGSNEEP